MYNPKDPKVLPMRAGVSPSCVVLPQQGQGSLLDFLTQRLSQVTRAEWAKRMAAGDVIDEFGQPATPERPFAPGIRLYYYREMADERVIAFTESVLYQDAHLLVADKPHFLPVVPTGPYVQQTLLVRLKQRLGLEDLSPIHRLDRDTAGLVLFSVQRATRGVYQALFRERAVYKRYEAVAPAPGAACPVLRWPYQHASRLEQHPHYHRMLEVAGAPNSLTQMQLLEQQGAWARYQLEPITGKRHQLRVHMAALGLPLWGDALYPQFRQIAAGDYRRPLQLLAKELAFTDPVSGQPRQFVSHMQLLDWADLSQRSDACVGGL